MSDNQDNSTHFSLWPWLALGAILLLATFMRFHNLDVPSIWIDEFNHYYAAQSLNDSGRATLPSGEPNERALLYSRMVAVAFRWFGAGAFSLRLPAALLGVLGVLAGFWITRQLFDQSTALLTALFMAISPFMLGWARLSRFYTLFQLLFMVGVYWFYLGYERGNQGRLARWQEAVLEKLRLHPLQRLLAEWKLNVFWLLAAASVLYVSYQVHQLTALFVVGLIFYAGMMALHEWRSSGWRVAISGKYFVTAAGLIAVLALALAVVPAAGAFLEYARTFMPKWAEGTRFQEKRLYIDFLFDHYNFPMGALFFIGALQVFARCHRAGLYVLSFFVGTLFMFLFVFSYAHFQYLFNVYPFLIMCSGYAFSNIMNSELVALRHNWFGQSRFRRVLPKVALLGIFLFWLPLTPALRLAKNIPFADDGNFNGAMYMDEWREACQFVAPRLRNNEIVISTDALGTQYYLGRVDFDLNFADADLAQEHQLIGPEGEYFDLYSGKPFIMELSQLEEYVSAGQPVWVLGQHYKLLEAPVFVPEPIRAFILEHFERLHATKNGTVLVYYYAGSDRVSLINSTK